ncbi:hypothetical protein, partial [Streptomyces lunaelactis]|uniref:hypothetical protein n=1 Tax=Streptomyces lunaelactis TaxID=1535768 RepID=UPI001C2FDC74
MNSPTATDSRPTVLAPRTLTRLTPADCTATQWDSSTQKANAANGLLSFIESGLHPEQFTQQLYRTCSQHLFGHIAHFDRHGFADTWFATTDSKAAFIEHALNAGSYGDPTHTWSDVEQHIQTALEAHPHLLNPATWPGVEHAHP